MIVCFACSLLLSGCGSKKPKLMSNEDYKNTQKILETLNMYIDGDVEGKQASEKLKSYRDKMTGKDNVTLLLG